MSSATQVCIEVSMIRRSTFIAPESDMTLPFSRGLPLDRVLAPREPANRKAASGIGVATPCGMVSIGVCPLSSPGCWHYRCMEGFLVREWDPVLPRCRCLHDPQPISDLPIGVGLPHLAGRYLPEGSPYLFGIGRSFRDTMVFLIRGWTPILLG